MVGRLVGCTAAVWCRYFGIGGCRCLPLPALPTTSTFASSTLEPLHACMLVRDRKERRLKEEVIHTYE